MKKLAFVTHEFGLFKGHGGVASYLHLLVSQILEREIDYEIYVLTVCYDEKSKLLANKKLKVLKIASDNCQIQGKQVLHMLVQIRPDIVEATDYLSLSLESLVYRAEKPYNELLNTVFITLHHTASRECYVWNDKVVIDVAPYHIREAFVRERTQMRLSDLNVAPSNFMCQYVKKNYSLDNVLVIPHPQMLDIVDKQEVLNKLNQDFELQEFSGKFIVNCISRIEGRKNQLFLVCQFIKFLKKTGADALLILVGNSSIDSVTGSDVKQEIYENIPEDFQDRILFYDFMGTKDKQQILAISDVTVLGSTFECLSLAMTESICMGVPVITSKYCGFTDYMSGCESFTIFDPFSEYDLSRLLEQFYQLDNSEKCQIAKLELNNLNLISSFENTISGRIRAYEKVPRFLRSCNGKILTIDYSNFLTEVTEDILKENYNSAAFIWNPQLLSSQKCISLFQSQYDNFKNNEVIAYGGQSIYLYFIDLIVYKIPFCIKGIRLHKAMLGKPLWEALIEYLDQNIEPYCLIDGQEDKLYNDGMPLSENASKEAEYFRKLILDHLFRRKNRVKLEELFSDE